MNVQMLEEVTSFKYQGSTLCKDGTCSAEISIRIASAVVPMARLNRTWHRNAISFTSRFKFHKSRITSILLCVCEIWTLLVASEKKGPGFRNQT